jgi:ferredoxin-NADP reductase
MDNEVVFRSRTELAPLVWEFVFDVKKLAEYVPGQYARFRFSDSVGLGHRTFTLTSHPTDRNISFIVRVDNPMSDYKAHLLSLQQGDKMQLDEPRGDAILPRLGSIPLVFVAQGIGIASYISILKEAALHDVENPMTLLWAHRSNENSILTDRSGLHKLINRIDFIKPTILTVEDILKVHAAEGLIYLSGGQRFVEDLGVDLENNGVPRERIVYDYYEGYTDL